MSWYSRAEIMAGRPVARDEPGANDDTIWIANRLSEQTLAAQSYRCAYCGAVAQLDADHKRPSARGGSEGQANLVGACRPCNNRKRAATVSEFRLRERLRKRDFNYTFACEPVLGGSPVARDWLCLWSDRFSEVIQSQSLAALGAS